MHKQHSLFFLAVAILIYLTSLLCPPALADENLSVVINIPSRTLELYKNGNVFKTYPVGVGRAAFQTPLGKFKVISKVKNPGWENPYKPSGSIRINSGNTSPLGTRWIGFKAHPKGEFGIHGTYQTYSVGKLSSHGCVRMFNKDIEEIYRLVQFGTPVFVQYKRTIPSNKKPGFAFKTHPDVYKIGKDLVYFIPSTDHLALSYKPEVISNPEHLKMPDIQANIFDNNPQFLSNILQVKPDTFEDKIP